MTPRRSTTGEPYWIEQFGRCGALWIYNGDPRAEQPHGEMTSKKHSNGFFNGTLVVREPKLCHTACAALLAELGPAKWQQAKSAWGSAMGAVTIAYQAAALMNVPFGYTEKDGDDMIAKRFPIADGEDVLMFEDVMTTGGTTRKSISALEKAGAKVMPYVLTLVNRSGMEELDGREIIALIDRELPLWDPADCPYCKAGSQALRPKGNWAKLTGQAA